MENWFSSLPPIQTTLAPSAATTTSSAISSTDDFDSDVERAILLAFLYSSTLLLLIALLVASFLMYRREQRITRSNKNENAASNGNYLLNPWAASASIFAASNGDVSCISIISLANELRIVAICCS